MNTRTLRHLIREYEITYKLPDSLGSSSTSKDSNAPSREKLIRTFKVLLGVVLLTQGLIFFNEQRSAISTFGNIIKALATAAAVAAGVQERVISRILLEAEETYKTVYGEIKSESIGELLKRNVDDISSKKNYLNIPTSIDTSIVGNFSSITSELSEKLGKLNDAVIAADKQSFPNSFSSFNPQPASIAGSKLGDVNSDELAIANSAMTDACAVAYYNSIHNQITSYLSALEELVSENSSIDKAIVKAHVTKILAVYDDEITGKASKILTGKPT
jgi:hypothetical protein